MKWLVNTVAVIKHIPIKNANYDAATDYLTLKHNEYTNKMIRDEQGNPIPREEYLLDGINCNPFTFADECESTNAFFHKNQTKEEVKAHHYIISFDPRDKYENGLTLEKAQELCVAFAKKNFPGHQTIVCAHPDGHNSAGNIHVHIVFNSVRKFNVEKQAFMERDGDALAGHKYHETDQLLNYLKQETMTMCQQESLYQVDLLSPAHVKITDREYWAQRKGQAALDRENQEKEANGQEITQTVFKTQNEFLREAIRSILKDSASIEEFESKLFEQYGISVQESRGRISYLAQDKSKPTRGRILGTDFEKEHIIEVLAENNVKQTTEALAKRTAIAQRYQTADIQKLIDVSASSKAQQFRGYERKLNLSNIQQMAKTVSFLNANNIHSLEELEQMIVSTRKDLHSKKAALDETRKQIAELKELQSYSRQFLSNKKVYREYYAAKDKKAFRREHENELHLYEEARSYLKVHGTTKQTEDGRTIVANPSLKSINEKLSKLYSLKNQQYEEWKETDRRYKEILTVNYNYRTMNDLPAQKTSKEKPVPESSSPEKDTKKDTQQL